MGADVTITALICLPFMLKRGYDKHMALGAIAAGGAIGVLIPPSIMFIVYGVTVGESIGKLFMGGVGPGILFASLYIGYILIKCYLNPAAGPAATEEEQNMPLAEKLTMLKLMIMPLLLIVTIIGSMFYLKAVAPPDVTMTDLYKSVMPYIGLQLVGLILCMIFPQIILWLPNYLGN